MSKRSESRRTKKSAAFRIGRVRVYLRGHVWYPCYHEGGQRYQPRVGSGALDVPAYAVSMSWASGRRLPREW